MEKYLLLGICLFFSLNVKAQESLFAGKNNFNNDWQFTLNEGASLRGIHQLEEGWQQVQLPHDWSIGGEFSQINETGAGGGYLPAGIGWYRKVFRLEEQLKDNKIFIRFDGVFSNSEVWINGHSLGQYPYGYSTFEYDLTPYLKFGKKNRIFVRADNHRQPASRWYTGAGIYRNTWLIVKEKTHFREADSFITFGEVSADQAVVHVQAGIVSNVFPGSDFQWWRKNPQANTRVTSAFRVDFHLLDAMGNQVASATVEDSLKDFSSAKVNTSLWVDQPALWSAADPNLYQLQMILHLENQPMDTLHYSVGIRTVNFDVEKGMLVNGIPTQLKGGCLHQDAGPFGVAVPVELWRYRLQNLKEMGCNAIRPSHHPFAPEFYALCNEMGFYVMDEAFDEWKCGNHWGVTEDLSGKVPYGYHRHFEQWAETDLRAMILRDRNHPCVVMYSIGNEIPDQRKVEGAETAKKLVALCHQYDSTRLVTAGCDFVAEANASGFMDALDIAGYNYVGRYTDRAMYQPEKAKYPNRLFVGTETFHDEYYWSGVKHSPFVIGEFVWSGYDYLGEAGKWPKRGWDAGIISMAEHNRPEYYLRKAYWSDEAVVRLAVENYPNPDITDWHPANVISHWNWKWKKGYLSNVFVYSNCDSIVVQQDGQNIYEAKRSTDQYQIPLKVHYKPGSLTALAYNKGKLVGEHQLQTAGRPVDFSLKLNKERLLANSDDLALLFISLEDAEGIIVPDQEHRFQVKVKGSGKLLGLESGDQYCHESYTANTKSTLNGRLTAFIGYEGKQAHPIEIEITDIDNGKQKNITINIDQYL
ncbi:glycoside hydrolase family 2 TIM barrel-domain containing protein [Persicobacter diffluens]